MDDRMTVEERVARQSEIKARLDEIDSEYSGAALPEETKREWGELQGEYSMHDQAIAEATERTAQLRALAERQEGTRGVERRGSHDPLVAPSKPANIYDLAEVRNKARSLDELPRLYRDNAMRAVEQARFPGVDRERAQAQVEKLLDSVDDENGELARRILITGSPTYDRAFGKTMKALSTGGLTAEEQRAMSLGSNGAGGYAVPFQLDPTVILTSDGSVNPLRQISRVEQIVGKEWQGVTSAGITVSRAAEAAQSSDNSPSLDQPVVRPTRVQGFVPFSIEIDQDWTAMRAEITRLLADAKEQEEAASFVTGNGTGVNPGGVVATLDSGSHVSTATINAFGVEDIYALDDALPPRFRARARFLAGKSVYNQVRQFDTQGGSNLWVRLEAGTPPELIGYPALEASEMASISGATGLTTGDKILLLGDFQQFLIVDRVGMSVELVPHLFQQTTAGTGVGMPTGQRGLYAIWRNSSLILADNAFRLLVVDGS